MELGQAKLRRFISSIERLQPHAHALPKRFNCETSVLNRIGVEPAQCRTKQRCCAYCISTLQVVKGRCDLDKCLEKRLFWLIACEPDSLPVLMSLEEVPAAIAMETFG